MHLAAMHSHKTIVDCLLCCLGLDVDICDARGRTPLWYAARTADVDCIDALLVHGANPGHKRWHIQYPLSQ